LSGVGNTGMEAAVLFHTLLSDVRTYCACICKPQNTIQTYIHINLLRRKIKASHHNLKKNADYISQRHLRNKHYLVNAGRNGGLWLCIMQECMQGCSNAGYQIAWVTKFCRLVPNICGTCFILPMAPRILRWFIDF